MIGRQSRYLRGHDRGGADPASPEYDDGRPGFWFEHVQDTAGSRHESAPQCEQVERQFIWDDHHVHLGRDCMGGERRLLQQVAGHRLSVPAQR
jgi:hypothetical protein